MRAPTPPYALIAGQGRSGSSWLLDLFDLSSRTHCRNEPNEVRGSRLSALPSADVEESEDQGLQEVSRLRARGSLESAPEDRELDHMRHGHQTEARSRELRET